MNVEIITYNDSFTEKNHIQINPIKLVEHFNEMFTGLNNTFKTERAYIRVQNPSNIIVVLGNSNLWVKVTEYLSWLEALSGIDLSKVKEVELSYVQGFSVPYEGATFSEGNDYYEGYLKLIY